MRNLFLITILAIVTLGIGCKSIDKPIQTQKIERKKKIPHTTYKEFIKNLKHHVENSYVEFQIDASKTDSFTCVKYAYGKAKRSWISYHGLNQQQVLSLLQQHVSIRLRKNYWVFDHEVMIANIVIDLMQETFDPNLIVAYECLDEVDRRLVVWRVIHSLSQKRRTHYTKLMDNVRYEFKRIPSDAFYYPR